MQNEKQAKGKSHRGAKRARNFFPSEIINYFLATLQLNVTNRICFYSEL
jgi:hypothetical protein